MARHAPSHRRELLRRFKEGEPPLALLKEATTITEPGHAAIALLAISTDERVESDRARSALQQARQLIDRIDRPTRIAEAWADALRILPDWRAGEQVPERAKFPDGLVRALERMPDGEWKRDVIVACAPVLPVSIQAKVMHHALANRGFGLQASKAVWDHGDHDVLRPVVEAHPEIAARLLARAGDRSALDAAWEVPDETGRTDALRVLVWQGEEEVALQDIVDSVAGRPPHEAAQVLTMVGAREDRLGIGDPAGRFDAAAHAIAEAPEDRRRKLTRKLDDARQRAGLTGPMPEGGAQPSSLPPAAASPTPTGVPPAGGPPSRPDGVPDPPSPGAPEPRPGGAPAAGSRPEHPSVPVQAGPRHVLALVDGYSGGLGNVHVRAVARAAPLCAAFGLDLALVGFPIDGLEAFVDLVEADTRIGEGGKHLEDLLGQGRLRALELHGGLPRAWPGHPVATTPHPEHSIRLESVPTPVCLLVGLGRQGIPRRILAAVPHHELTGKAISLETATAMGILADRLGRLPR